MSNEMYSRILKVYVRESHLTDVYELVIVRKLEKDTIIILTKNQLKELNRSCAFLFPNGL